MKVLWISNAPWQPSGYGSQTRQVGRRIAAAGYDIEFTANDGTQGSRMWEGLRVRGSGNDIYSRDKVREDLARSGADWVVSLYDGWVYTTGRKDPFDGLKRVAAWLPIDHFPAPMSLYGWLRAGHTQIAMSQFGKMCLERLSDAWADEGHRFPVTYAPHAIEDVFRPTPSDFRQSLGIPADAYLVGIVAANTGSVVYDRKGFGDMADALGHFMGLHDDVWLYVHSERDADTARFRMDLDGLFAFKGIPAERVRFVDQYRLMERDITDEEMAQAYTAFDVLLSTSRGEGFGVPVIEAQGCGTPVIASNWTAQAELVGEVYDPYKPASYRAPSGWLVGVQRDYDPRQGADFAVPAHGSIVRALEEAYNLRGDGNLRDAAIGKAASYRADPVFDAYWRPILGAMEDATKPVPLNRSQRRKADRERGRLAAVR